MSQIKKLVGISVEDRFRNGIKTHLFNVVFSR